MYSTTGMLAQTIHRSALAAVFWVALACTPESAGDRTTIYIVRHAEKVDESEDPALTAAGRARAAALRDILHDVRLTAIYSTHYKRTKNTVRPAATAKGIELTIIGPKGLAAKLLDRHRGDAVLVAGHSNTVPALIAALGVADPPTIEPQQYGDLFVVTIRGSQASLRRRHFGP